MKRKGKKKCKCKSGRAEVFQWRFFLPSWQHQRTYRSSQWSRASPPCPAPGTRRLTETLGLGHRCPSQGPRSEGGKDSISGAIIKEGEPPPSRSRRSTVRTVPKCGSSSCANCVAVRTVRRKVSRWRELFFSSLSPRRRLAGRKSFTHTHAHESERRPQPMDGVRLVREFDSRARCWWAQQA